ncbi:MAG: hypothetical protein LAQ30_06825 [Acidobacteriia bacterium]|nr:hypothetical protein [Terriglobia bacterium]
MLSVLARGPAVRFVLNDFNRVPVRVCHVEIGVADAPLSDVSGDLNAAGAQIDAHGFGVVGLNRNVVQPAGIGFLLGEEFDVLPVVYLDERERQAAIRVLQLERLSETKKILVEGARFFDIVREKGDVRDAGDSRALRGIRR